MTGQSKKVTRW